MSVTVLIPTPLRPFTGGAAELQVSAVTVGNVLERVVEQHPALRQHLYNERGELRNFVNAYVNEDDIRTLRGASTPVHDGNAITIVPSIAVAALIWKSTSNPGAT